MSLETPDLFVRGMPLPDGLDEATLERAMNLVIEWEESPNQPITLVWELWRLFEQARSVR